MTTTKKAKKKGTEKRERTERRFEAESTHASRLTTLTGMAGGLALGAGVYAQWVREDPLSFAPYLVAAGGVALGGALFKTGAEPAKVRVGEAGVALEKGADLTRILWCDVERIALEGDTLVVRGKEATVSFRIDEQPKAAAWVVSEAQQRVPGVVGLSEKERERFGKPNDKDGEVVRVDELQIAGRNCRASDKPIAFERDARLCPTCSEVYLKDQVPKKCLTCQADLGARAREV